ncbi:cistern family PEP-CTERM protein [Sphingomonas tabacisoli]|uniref:Cistern family PEP-CTERM protein n=1 Tax=Sphingomonas tabacisoli TaxID=2249466 RepID=A0ABW4I771_9SPHN
MNFRTAFLAAAGAAAIGLTAPASAATVVLNAGSPKTFTMNFNGFTSAAQAPLPGLTAKIDFSFLGRVGNAYNFSYKLTNTSSAPIDSTQLVIFGFNTDPNVSSVSTGANDQFNITASGNQPNGLASIDLCFKDAGQTNNCTGAQGNSGLAKGAFANGTFSLVFNSVIDKVTLSDFSVRYQALNSTQLGISGGSASGLGTIAAVPEPATWAMMIGGFGLIGAAARRRQRTAVTYA